MTFLIFLWTNKTARAISMCMIILLIVGGYIAVLRYQVKVQTREAEAANREAKRVQQESEGLKVLINTNTVAREVEDAKKLANNQQTNINTAGNNFNNSVLRQTNTFAGSSSDNEFCLRFKCDDTCLAWRERNKVVCPESR